jgi:hypothetical protein
VSAYTVRLYQQRDAEEMHPAALESVAEVYPWMAWCHRRYSLDEARQWVAVQEKLAKQGMAYEFAILGEGGRFLGGCGSIRLVRRTDLRIWATGFERPRWGEAWHRLPLALSRSTRFGRPI